MVRMEVWKTSIFRKHKIGHHPGLFWDTLHLPLDRGRNAICNLHLLTSLLYARGI